VAVFVRQLRFGQQQLGSWYQQAARSGQRVRWLRVHWLLVRRAVLEQFVHWWLIDQLSSAPELPCWLMHPVPDLQRPEELRLP
jgi:hypothetical protein